MASEYWDPISFGPHQIVGHDLIYVPRSGQLERLDLTGGQASFEASEARQVAGEEDSPWGMVGLTGGPISAIIGVFTGGYRAAPVRVAVIVALASGRVVRIDAPGGLERSAKRFVAALNEAASTA